MISFLLLKLTTSCSSFIKLSFQKLSLLVVIALCFFVVVLSSGFDDDFMDDNDKVDK